ncbi:MULTISPECIES: ferredoxin [Mycobacteriaceae]|uniref:Ferredoxin n=1 Tax=Mycolicibacterium parafortuitum TaxID=39692 RepID=A0ACC6MQ02_MYCPF|nr:MULTISPECIES: ferredoxin [Mycobacteriaceae]MDZ5089069.1 ferredoxin [Mycolicibacterium parafortuitum]BBA72527.1 phthalate 3,4-dioxygenase ferredoxin subunit [Mycobacterium sp. PO1]GFM19745.1 phthalate 3,4-dioxygenase ferredoxin subunit [Mycobacterium sp. PO1]GFM26757.1 phthalate 3,4-dioxygenase ferredoxin subunit [Mycobacterium sp. PO2]
MDGVIKANHAVCQGYANCVVAAEDYFDIDDRGLVLVRKTEVPSADRTRVEEAARSCPVVALEVLDE